MGRDRQHSVVLHKFFDLADEARIQSWGSCQRVRLYVINAGPNLGSAFHSIGGMFATVYPDADAKHALSGVSTYPITPGQGVVFDAIIPHPGKYPIVDHNMRDMMIGAAGELHVTP
jgi:nitrite reductase (NO-forming)